MIHVQCGAQTSRNIHVCNNVPLFTYITISEQPWVSDQLVVGSNPIRVIGGVRKGIRL